MTQPSRVALALSSIFAGTAGGAAVSTIFVWLSWRGWPFLSVFGDPRNLVFAGNILAPIVALVVSWRLSPLIEETWRRAAMAVTAAAGAFAAGWAAFGVSMYSMMVSSPFLTEGLVPAYFLVMAVIWYVSLRVARKQQQLGGAPPAL
jgi:hypothetical protein